MYRVRLSNHAKERFRERFGITSKNRIEQERREIERRLHAVLKLGVEPDEGLGVRIYIPDRYVAQCYPDFMGGWTVATVWPPGFEEPANASVKEVEAV